MKTKTTFRFSGSPFKVLEKEKDERSALKVIFRSDLKNHRFSVIDNKQIHDPINWDTSWFAHYE
jgi:hypothetical protein